MASWLEKLGLQRTRPPKEELKDFCLELCPDNRIASFMITDHTPRSGNPFIRFVKEAARKAVLEEARGVPDNLLLFYAGIRKEELPPSNGLLEKEPRQAWRFIIENGGITDGNSVPLRRAAYLEAHGVETDRRNLEGLEHSPGYKDFVAHETARERILQGKNARFLVTAVKTDQGVQQGAARPAPPTRIPAGNSRQFLLILWKETGDIVHIPHRDLVKTADGDVPATRKMFPRLPARTGSVRELPSGSLLRAVTHGGQPRQVHYGRLPGTFQTQSGYHDPAGHRRKRIRPPDAGGTVPLQEGVRPRGKRTRKAIQGKGAPSGLSSRGEDGGTPRDFQEDRRRPVSKGGSPNRDATVRNEVCRQDITHAGESGGYPQGIRYRQKEKTTFFQTETCRRKTSKTVNCKHIWQPTNHSPRKRPST